jgi:hypothetical protein
MGKIFKIVRFGQTLRGMIYEVVEIATGKRVFTGTRTEAREWVAQRTPTGRGDENNFTEGL